MKNSILYLLLIIFIGLYATNPTKAEFNEFAKDYVKNEVISQGVNSDSFITKLVKFFSDKATETAVDMYVEREDYYLFSIYKFQGSDYEYRFLGIFRKFIPLKDFIDVSKINLRFRDPRVLINEDIKLNEDYYWSQSINIKVPTEVTLSGELLSGPAVELYCFEENQFLAWKERINGAINKEVLYLPALSESGFNNITKTTTLVPGNYYIVIENTDYGRNMPPMNFTNDESYLKLKIIVKEIN